MTHGPQGGDVPDARALVFGCAQLGMPYGRTNSTGQPDRAVAAEMLDVALSAGVRWFDTARAYGESETILGSLLPAAGGLQVVTKLSPLATLASDAEPRTARAATRASIDASLRALGRLGAPTMLLHRALHLASHGGAVWGEIQAAQSRGELLGVGVSVQVPSELLQALSDQAVSHVQFPFNLLDHRWLAPEVRDALDRRRDVTIHVRSVFLQGVLVSDAGAWPVVAGVDAGAMRGVLLAAAARCGRSLPELCVDYVRAALPVDGLVVGMETRAQVAENVRLISSSPLTVKELAHLNPIAMAAPLDLLDPSRWNAPS